MTTIALRLFRDAEVGTVIPLARAGSGLENPFVYDASARDLKQLEQQGRLRVVDERKAAASDGDLITYLAFTKLC